ncbi:Holliday junction resolvase RecU [Levilactobacillus bambusae]|uniref:Holliday junction resolvase RecU n=1 Tax=Levilactobacillus bambusae TaxID=2024736 RepID=A0A2V1N0R6_9LACO|nr:Holliday junction resolvase RecU [Levilactobacillus bambusae]PWG00871.1 Holliday junction resolvase RecU [Levilactobacillus bambusae]
MTIRYPNGTVFHANATSTRPKLVQRTTTYGKRGMALEDEINASNTYYLEHQVAVIHKKPTPINIVKVDYPKRSSAVIREAYFSEASTTDYNGIYRGRYIDFDAKETRNKTAFPLKNFHQHQVEHLRRCVAQGGICFALIKFKVVDRVFLLKASDLFNYWDSAEQSSGRKSIPFTDVEQIGYEVRYKMQPLIPYLDAVDNLIDDNLNSEKFDVKGD